MTGYFSNTADGKRLDIQGLRAIAALSVVLFHATDLLPGGFLGVDIFFVISGFIVSQIAKTEVLTTGRFSLTKFFGFRLRRLLPPMAVVVLVTLAIGLFVDTPSRMIEKLPVAGMAALAGIINFYFLGQATDYFQSFQSNPLLHLWSLSVEIQFYFLFAIVVSLGLALISMLSDRRVVGFVIGGVVALMAISLGSALTIKSWHHAANIALPEIFSFFMLPTRIWEFCFGIIANFISAPLRARLTSLLAVHLLQVVGLVLLFVGLKFGSNAWLVPGFQAIAPCFGAALLLATGDRGIIGRALSFRVMVYLGDRSYSIYLWQGPLIGFAAILFATPWAISIAAFVSILISIASYGTVETMFRRRQNGTRRSAASPLRVASAYFAAILICAACYVFTLIVVSRFEAPAPLRATTFDTKCERQRGVLGIKPCVYGEAGRPTVLLIGDSHAGAISQVVIDAGIRNGWQVHVATASACSVPEYPEDVEYRSSCAGYTENILKYVLKENINIVILQQFSEFYTLKLRIGIDRWQSGLADFLSSLAQSHVPAIVIGDNIRLPIAVGRPFWVESWKLNMKKAIESRYTLEEAERHATTMIAGNQYILAREYICNGSMCPIFEKGTWLYTDTDHLSFKGAELLQKPLDIILTQVSRSGWIDSRP